MAPEMDIEAMPEPPKRKSSSAPVGSFSEMNRKLEIAESRIEELREHLSLVENDAIEKNKSLLMDFHEFNEKIDSMRKETENLKEVMERIISKLEMFAGKEQVKVLERYLNFWNPLDYVSKKDVEELINTKLKSRGKKTN